MKVLFLTNIPSPYRVAFFEEFGKLVQLTVLYERVMASDRNEKWKAEAGKSFTEIYLSGKKIGYDGALCMSVIQYLSDKQFDYIIVGGYSTPTGILSIIYLKWKRIPFILNIDGGFIKKELGFKRIIKSCFIGSASAWLSPSCKADEYIIYYGARKDMIFRYPFTSTCQGDILLAPLSCDDKVQIKRKLGVKNSALIISVGSFIHRKGFDILIEIAAQLSEEAEFWLIGGGNEYNAYEELIEQRQAFNVKLIPFMVKDELMRYYDAADIFVLPTREDVWGLVINEAMARGLPIITTDKCGAGVELIEDGGNGYIVSCEDENGLLEKIKSLITNEELQQRMGRQSLAKIRGYTFSQMALCHYHILEKLGSDFRKRSKGRIL